MSHGIAEAGAFEAETVGGANEPDAKDDHADFVSYGGAEIVGVSAINCKPGQNDGVSRDNYYCRCDRGDKFERVGGIVVVSTVENDGECDCNWIKQDFVADWIESHACASHRIGFACDRAIKFICGDSDGQDCAGEQIAF